MSITCHSQKYHKTSRNLLEEYVLDCMYSSFTKITYTDLSPLPLWISFSELSEMLSPGLQSSFCPRYLILQLNLQLSYCAFFFLIDSFMATKKKGLGMGFSLSPELYEELES